MRQGFTNKSSKDIGFGSDSALYEILNGKIKKMCRNKLHVRKIIKIINYKNH